MKITMMKTMTIMIMRTMIFEMINYKRITNNNIYNQFDLVHSLK
jgi:hypothetical protein